MTKYCHQSLWDALLIQNADQVKHAGTETVSILVNLKIHAVHQQYAQLTITEHHVSALQDLQETQQFNVAKLKEENVIMMMNVLTTGPV